MGGVAPVELDRPDHRAIELLRALELVAEVLHQVRHGRIAANQIDDDAGPLVEEVELLLDRDGERQVLGMLTVGLGRFLEAGPLSDMWLTSPRTSRCIRRRNCAACRRL